MGSPILVGYISDRGVEWIELFLASGVRDRRFVASEDDRDECSIFGIILCLRSGGYDILEVD